jgi:hypothetical protein
VLNPGTVVPQCFDGAADVLLTYEGDASTYINNYPPLGWTPQKSQLWHIVYGASADQIQTIVNDANQRGAGYLEVTDGALPNPYNKVPAYWTQELNTVSGGAPNITPATPWASGGGAPATPSGVSVTASDYTSVTLGWSPDPGASRYLINVNNQYSLEVPDPMTSATVGGLQPGQTYTFTVSAIDPGGYISPPASAGSVTTTSLPASSMRPNDPFSDASGGDFTATSISYHATIYEPFGFRHVFISTTPNDNSGWYTSLSTACPTCAPFQANYMIENGNLYKYAGTGTNWTWTYVAATVPTINGYTYTWNCDPSWFDGATTQHVLFEGDGYYPSAITLPRTLTQH